MATTGYVTGVSGYIQSQISAIRDGTGTFVSFSQTGNFYPSSNPSGFITGVNLTPYQTIDGSTGISGYLQGQISSINSSTGLFVTGQVVRPSQTGSFLTGVDLSTYATIALATGISGYQSGLISSLYDATGLYALKSSTGSFLTTGAADLRFYPLSSNPSEYLTASSITDLATTGYVTGVSGHLQSQVLTLNSFSGQSITGYNRSITGLSIGGSTTKTITLFQQNGSTLTADFSDLQGTGGDGSSDNSVLLTGDQNISGVKNFYSRPTVNGTGVLLNGEAAGAANTGELTGAFYPLNSNPSGYITGVDLSAYVTGSVVRPSETGSFITTSQTGAFYPSSNPSGFITGVDLSAYVTTGQTGQFVTGSVVRPSETGVFVTSSQTGQFVGTGSTGSFVVSSATGAFLTTGAADGRYYGLSNGESISGFATTGFNDAVTGMTITGDATKFITLFQRDGTTITGSFTDNAGTGGGSGTGSISVNDSNLIISISMFA